MAWEIVKQPRRRGEPETLYARFTTVTMSNTHSDLSAPQMVIRLVREGYCSVDEARRLVEGAAPALKDKTPYQSGQL